MSKDWDSIRKMREENEQNLREKRLNDRYWQELESRSGYGK